MTNPAPLPWTAKGDGGIYDANNRVVVRVYWDWDSFNPEPLWESVERLIVNSVNNSVNVQRLVEVANEARLQIEYLHEKFIPTGSGEAVLARLKEAIEAVNAQYVGVRG